MNGIRTAARPIGRVLLLGAILILGGCSFISGPTSSFPMTTKEIRTRCDEMKKNPVGLSRPLIVIDGWRQFDWSSAGIARQLRDLTGGEKSDVIPVSFPMHTSLHGMADEIVMRVERAWPSDDPEWTSEVDVVGHSMGGIVGRLAALPNMKGKERKRLKIRTLYTIATPHRGARLAKFFPIDQPARDMRVGSKLIAHLNESLPEARYELVCYTQLNDWTVGAKQTAPPGQNPIWTKGNLIASHMLAPRNLRILGDIALRLRGEEPIARPSEPPPSN